MTSMIKFQLQNCFCSFVDVVVVVVVVVVAVADVSLFFPFILLVLSPLRPLPLWFVPILLLLPGFLGVFHCRLILRFLSFGWHCLFVYIDFFAVFQLVSICWGSVFYRLFPPTLLVFGCLLLIGSFSLFQPPTLFLLLVPFIFRRFVSLAVAIFFLSNQPSLNCSSCSTTKRQPGRNTASLPGFLYRVFLSSSRPHHPQLSSSSSSSSSMSVPYWFPGFHRVLFSLYGVRSGRWRPSIGKAAPVLFHGHCLQLPCSSFHFTEFLSSLLPSFWPDAEVEFLAATCLYSMTWFRLNDTPLTSRRQQGLLGLPSFTEFSWSFTAPFFHVFQEVGLSGTEV